jgi:hypothetical protein
MPLSLLIRHIFYLMFFCELFIICKVLLLSVKSVARLHLNGIQLHTELFLVSVVFG